MIHTWGILILAAFAASAVMAAEPPAGVRARIIPPVREFPTDDLVIASAVATEAPFGAVADGRADCAPAIQKAIDAVAHAGGGVVFLPAGRYRCADRLVVRPTVWLRGQRPAPDAGQTVAGTILMPTTGRDEPDGPPFIDLVGSCGLADLSIWYPEQTPDPIAAYPWTIQTGGHGEQMCGTVLRVTLVNSYRAIHSAGLDGLHTISQVRGTALAGAIQVDFCADIGRLRDITFGPDAWLNSGLIENSPANAKAIRQFMRDRGVGMLLRRADWEYSSGVTLSGYGTGIHIMADDRKALNTNAVFHNVRATGGRVGLRVDALNYIGLSLVGCTLDGDETAVIHRTDSVCQFNACTLGGSAGVAVRNESAGTMTFQNCAFPAWCDVAIASARGSISSLGCRFGQAGLAVRAGQDVARVRLLGNRFTGPPQWDVRSAGEVIVAHDDLAFTRVGEQPIVLPPDPRPAGQTLVNVLDRGAVGDGRADNTAAFQKALDEAGRAGGGTVYVPGGLYRFEGCLSVPAGVELRGAFDGPHHTIAGGVTLLPVAGRDRPDDPPFVTLAGRCGIRGLTVWYPQQDLLAPRPYPWTVRVAGAGCWAKDLCLGNPWQGVDAPTGDRLLLRCVAGGPLRTGLRIGPGDSVIDSCHFNPHFAMRQHASYPSATTRPATPAERDRCWRFQATHVDGFVFLPGSRSLQVDNFVFAARTGLLFADGAADATTAARVINHGSDAALCGVAIDSPGAADIELVNAEVSCWGAGLAVGESFRGTLRTFGTLLWGMTGPTAAVAGRGDVLLQSWHSTQRDVRVAGPSRVRLEAGVFDQAGLLVRATSRPDALVLIGNDTRTDQAFEFEPGPAVRAVGNGSARQTVRLDAPAERLFATGLSPGQPAATTQGRVDRQRCMTDISCRVARPAGDNDVLVLTARCADPRTAFVYCAVSDVDIPVTEHTWLTYRVRAVNLLGRHAGVELVFNDGSVLRDGGRDRRGWPMHPAAAKGETGEWTTIQCHVGQRFAGKRIRQVQAAAGPFNGPLSQPGPVEVWFDDLAIVNAPPAQGR